MDCEKCKREQREDDLVKGLIRHIIVYLLEKEKDLTFEEAVRVLSKCEGKFLGSRLIDKRSNSKLAEAINVNYRFPECLADTEN